jgi:hypothetical protein
MSTPTLGPTQLTFQWVLGIVYLGVKNLVCEAEHLNLLSRIKMKLHSLTCLLGVNWDFTLFFTSCLWCMVDTFGGGIALEVGRSRGRFLMGSVEFFIDLILLAAPEPSSPLSL